jgi:hypothetical protein
MESKPTSSEKKFLFKRQFNTKRTLVFDLNIESGDKDTVPGNQEQEERVAVLRVSDKKLKSITLLTGTVPTDQDYMVFTTVFKLHL